MTTMEDLSQELMDGAMDVLDVVVAPGEQPKTMTSKPGVKKKRKQAKEGGFRKAPQAPKRFKSPYILFSISKMEQYKKELGSKTKVRRGSNVFLQGSISHDQGSQVTSISRLVADEWKKLSPEERSKWDEVAKRDKERYIAEKSLYTGPWQVPSKRTRKDPSAPKRPMSAFLLYSQGLRQKLKAENPTLKNTEISRLLGEQWKAASEEERKPHIERERRERGQYNKDIAEWRRQRDDREKAFRKHRQEVAEQWMKSGNRMPTGGPWLVANAQLPPVGDVPVVHPAPPPPPGQPLTILTTHPMQWTLPPVVVTGGQDSSSQSPPQVPFGFSPPPAQLVAAAVPQPSELPPQDHHHQLPPLPSPPCPQPIPPVLFDTAPGLPQELQQGPVALGIDQLDVDPTQQQFHEPLAQAYAAAATI